MEFLEVPLTINSKKLKGMYKVYDGNDHLDGVIDGHKDKLIKVEEVTHEIYHFYEIGKRCKG